MAIQSMSFSLVSSLVVLSVLGRTDRETESVPDLNKSIASLSDKEDRCQLMALTRSLADEEKWNRKTRRAAYRAAQKAMEFAHKLVASATRKR